MRYVLFLGFVSLKFLLLTVILHFCFRYNERIVWTDKELNLKLMRKGILTRVYAPSVSSIDFISNVYNGMVFYILWTYAWLLDIVKLLIFFSSGYYSKSEGIWCF